MHLRKKAALQEFVLVNLGSEVFGLPVARVVSIFRIDASVRVPIAGPGIAGVVNHRGQMIAAVSLRRRLDPAAPEIMDGALAAGIDRDGEIVALIIDGVGDVVRFDATSEIAIPASFDGTRAHLTAAVYASKNGFVSILDLDALFRIGTLAADAA